MTVRPIQVVRLRGWQRDRLRDRMVDHVGRTRNVGYRGLFDHDGCGCNMLAAKSPFTADRRKRGRPFSAALHAMPGKRAIARAVAGVSSLGAPAGRTRRGAVALAPSTGASTGSALSAPENAGRRSGSTRGTGRRMRSRPSDRFFALPPQTEYELDGDRLTFPSAVITPHAPNNTVHARFFPETSPRGRRRAVLVLPQWNADEEGHVALCRLLNRLGITALRLTLPYHHERKLPELRRADYIVSANIGRTLQVCRQAVLDGRRAIAWLASQGYESIGVVGTSLGSCLSMLIAAHEPLVKAAALNHISPYFADVIWEGLSTAASASESRGTDRSGPSPPDLDADLTVSLLERVRGKNVLLVYAQYDLTFPVGCRGCWWTSSGAEASATSWRCFRAVTTARP